MPEKLNIIVSVNDLKKELDLFLEREKKRPYSEFTIGNYKLGLERFQEYLSIKKITNLTNHDIQETLDDYVNWLLTEKKYGPSTVNQYLLRISPLLSNLHFEYALSFLETENEQLPKHLKPTEIKEVLKTIPKSNTYRKKDSKIVHRDEAIIKVIYNTGATISELVALNIENLKETPSGYAINIKNRDKTRNVGINYDTYNTIKTMLKDRESLKVEDPLFINRKGTRLAKRTIQRMFTKLGKATDERIYDEEGYDPRIRERLTPFSLRHSLAIQLLNENEELSLVQKTLGHKHIISTQEYIKDDNEDVVEKLSTTNLGINDDYK